MRGALSVLCQARDRSGARPAVTDNRGYVRYALNNPGLDRILRGAVRHDFPVNILCWASWTRVLP